VPLHIQLQIFHIFGFTLLNTFCTLLNTFCTLLNIFLTLLEYNLHTETTHNLSMISRTHKHNIYGHLLQDYYFAAQGLEVHCTKETGITNKYLLIFLTVLILISRLIELNFAERREFIGQIIYLTDNSSSSPDIIT
jgi:hypothetical protein